MFQGIHHVAFVAYDRSRVEEFSDQFDMDLMYLDENPEVPHNTALYRAGDTLIEICYPVKDYGSIYEVLEEQGEGYWHIAFEVDDIRKRITELQDRGIPMEHDEPQPSGVEGPAWELANIAHEATITPMQIIEENRDNKFDF